MRLVFAGTPDFAERSLAALLASGHDVALVLTQPDRPAGRGLRAESSPVKRLALKHGLGVFQPSTLKRPEALEPLREARPEVLVVAAYGLILPPPVLEIAPHGAINIHASLLPRWRGAAPIQRALLAGDRQTGISIMQMDAGLDTGPVLGQRIVPIDADDDAGSLHDKLAAVGAGMIVSVLDALPSGTFRAVPQPAEGACYAAKIERAETLLDWARPADQLERAIRAFRPTPGARTAVQAESIKIWRASVVPGAGRPGEVLHAGNDALVVACGRDALAISELQRAGGRRLAVADFLRGQRLPKGLILGAPVR